MGDKMGAAERQLMFGVDFGYLWVLADVAVRILWHS